MKRPSAGLVVGATALVVAVGGVGWAKVPASDGDVHLCYSKKTGAVEVVDQGSSASDRTRCDRGWAGFVVDTTPTKLVSPNGQYRVEVTDTGAVMRGPNGSAVRLSTSAVTVETAGQVTVQGAVVRLGGPTCGTPVARLGDGVTTSGSQGVITGGAVSVLSC